MSERAQGSEVDLRSEPLLAEPYPTLDLDTFLSKPPAAPDWDLQGWFARGDLVLVFGDPGVGKSLWALATAVKAVAEPE